MEDDPRNHRRSIRLKDFDYTRGAVYCLTICTNGRRCILGRVVDGQTQLNRLGRIVEDAWLASLEMRRYLALDAYVIMPNHMHGIIATYDSVMEPVGTPEGARSAPLQAGASHRRMRPRSLGSFVAGFKAAVTRRASAAITQLRLPLWQRNYYEHIIRDDRDLERIRSYIAANPARWEEDGYHPRFLRHDGVRAASERPQ